MPMMYFSSATGSTHKSIEKLGIKNARIPIRRDEPELIVDEPYALICPVYSGGASTGGGNLRPVLP